jgi:hypothetical protein
MSIAEAIPVLTATRAARAAARTAARVVRDAFIQAEFPQMAARFEEALGEALGRHAQIHLTVTPTVEGVQGRSFATLNQRVVRVRASFGALPQTVTFTPQLSFREPDQYGLIACALDFDYFPRRTRADETARAFLEHGIQLRGTVVSRLLLPLGGSLREVGARELEEAFTVWWLR